MPHRKREHIEIEIPSKAVRIQHAACLNGHSLMDADHKINGYPSVRVLARHAGEEGLIYLDPVYGSFKNLLDIDVKKGEVVELFCPECHVPLKDDDQTCDLCAAPMFAIHLPQGGIIEGCLRDGCHFHNLRLIDGEQLLKRLYEDNALDSYL